MQSSNVITLMIYTVTPLHVGSGRSGGVVDLPVQRDPFGYPLVYASSFKGALKSFCGEKYDLPLKDGRLDCEKAKICCCLFGPEKGDETGSGIVTVTDLIPLFVPVPSMDKGYIYVTSKYLLGRALDVLELGGDAELKKVLASLYDQKEGSVKGTAEVDVAGVKKPAFKVGIELFKGLGKLAEKLKEGVVVLDDDEGSEVLERSYIRVTRNSIDLTTKTVKEGALWTEEYLPQGTVMIGALVPSVPKDNKYCAGEGSNNVCDWNCFNEKLGAFLKKVSEDKGDGVKTFFINLGGKETIGKGIIKVVIKWVAQEVTKEVAKK